MNYELKLTGESAEELQQLLRLLGRPGGVSTGAASEAPVMADAPRTPANVAVGDAVEAAEAELAAAQAAPWKDAQATTAAATPGAAAQATTDTTPTDATPTDAIPADTAGAVTLEDVRTVARKLAAAGHGGCTKAVLDGYGVRGLSALPEEAYGPVLATLQQAAAEKGVPLDAT